MAHFFKTIGLFLIFILAFTSCKTKLKAERQKQFILEQTQRKEEIQDSVLAARVPKGDIDKNYLLYYDNGKIAHNRGEYSEAIGLFDESLKLNPDFSDAWGMRGLSKYKLGDTQSACKDWNKAKELGNVNLQTLIDTNCM